MNGEAGKGDRYRNVDRNKWDEGWIRAFGKSCNICKATGKVRVVSRSDGPDVDCRFENCPFCHGIGKVEK